MNMKEIEKYGPDFMYFEEPDAPINNGFFEHLQNLTESMTMVRKVIDIRSNYISKEPQEIVNQMFDNNSERINNWLNRDFATENLVDKGNLGKVSAIDWDIIKQEGGGIFDNLAEQYNTPWYEQAVTISEKSLDYDYFGNHRLLNRRGI